jgi:MFS family permease
MRPLGAVVLGAYIDRRGRRAGLLLTLGLMGAGTVLIGAVPGYATIGVLAPLLVLTGRLLQGLSAGVELGAVSVYLAEIATPGRKGFYVSWQSASQQASVVFVALLGVGLTHVLSPAQREAWGWRVPFWIGSLVVPFLFMLRRSLEETGEFLARKRRPSKAEIARSMTDHWSVILTGAMLVMLTTVAFYMITAYAPTFGRGALGLGERDILLVTLAVGLSNFCWLPVMGALSDRLGRRPLLLGFAALAAASAYPAMSWLASAPSLSRLLAVSLWLSFLYAGYNGAMVVSLTEIMPAEVRTVGFSLAYSLATAVFGGFTPALCTYLIHATGNRAIPGAWLSVAAVSSFAAALLIGPGRSAASLSCEAQGSAPPGVNR